MEEKYIQKRVTSLAVWTPKFMFIKIPLNIGSELLNRLQIAQMLRKIIAGFQAKHNFAGPPKKHMGNQMPFYIVE